MTSRRASALLVPFLLFAGCLGDDEKSDEGEEVAPPPPTDGGDEGPFALASAAFGDGEPIPRKYTCDAGNDEPSPPLNMTGVPSNASSVALIVEDRDVPFPELPQRTITHWTIWNLVPGNGTVTFPEDTVPEGSREGAEGGWNGPCPPVGSNPHRYNFTAYALDNVPDVEAGAPRTELEAAMEGHVLATARLIGTYARQPLV